MFNDEMHSSRWVLRGFIIFQLWLLIFGAVALGKGPAVSEIPQEIPRAQAKRLFIVGFAGSVTLSANTKSDNVSVRALKYGDGEEPTVTSNYLSQFSVHAVNTGDTIEVRALPPSSNSEWTRWSHPTRHSPEVKLDISAPATMSLEIFWTRGDIKVFQWKAPVFITSQDGHLSVENGSSDLTARTMFGAVKVENIRGNVNIENFASQLTISEVTGHAKIRTFSGEVHLKKIVGPVVISSQKATVNTQDTLGGMDIQSGLATFHILDHKGSLVGHSDGGAINAHIKGPVDVRLGSQSGALTLSVGRESQASVSLSTKGQLNAPKELEKKSGPDSKVIQGELNGSQPGHIRLTSETGDLNLKIL